MRIEQRICDIGELRAEYQTDLNGSVTVSRIRHGGEEMCPTRRFWTSFSRRFRIAEPVFRYFEPAEVFDRISQRSPHAQVRYCLQREDKKQPRLLAVTTPGRPFISYDEADQLIRDYQGTDVEYKDGVLSSTHLPSSGAGRFQVGGDAMENRFRIETPIDGYGHPRIHLAMLRLVCTNGMVGYSKSFRSDVSLGKDVRHCIVRALESFDNGEGYMALRQRIESAQTSWASVHECLRLYSVLSQLKWRPPTDDASFDPEQVLGRPPRGMFDDFRELTGNLNLMYGLANLDAISIKRQRVLPSKCRVYDLVNFATEVATHHATLDGRQTLHAFVGSLISDEYDLEGTAETLTEFDDFLISAKDADAGSSSQVRSVETQMSSSHVSES